MTQTFTKDPAATLDYQIDWTTWLGGVSPEDNLASSVWTLPSGITQESESETLKVARIWVSGGTLGQTYDLVNTIVTTGGRTNQRTIRVIIRDQ